MSSVATKLISAALSTGAGLCVWYVYLAGQGPGANVRLVETRAEVAEFFEERVAEAEAVVMDVEVADANSVMVGSFNYAEMEEEVVRKMFPGIRRPNPLMAYDPQCFMWHVPGYSRMAPPRGTYKKDVLITNKNLGFRKVADVFVEQPDLRILVTGDSHTEGVVPMAFHYTELIESALRDDHADMSIEVLNAGVGGTSFFQYLGVMEKFKSLKPDVVVAAIYGGNDFSEARRPYRFFHRLPLESVYPRGVMLKVKRVRENIPQLYA
jgi:hypothetical protein